LNSETQLAPVIIGIVNQGNPPADSELAGGYVARME